MINTATKAALAAVALAAAGICLPVQAQPQRHGPPHEPNAFRALEGEAGLARAARPDTTPRERYASAVREAYGALKYNQDNCRHRPARERKRCMDEAQQLFKADMGRAQALLNQPGSSPR